jgi:hypothetical protein
MARAANHFRFEEADHRFRERVIVRIAATADRRRDAGIGEAIGVPHRQVLRAAIAVMDKPLVRSPRS